MTEITAFVSPSGQNYTRGAGPATRIMVGTLEGVATLQRDSVTAPWKLRGRSLADKHVAALVHEPVSGKLFAAAHDDGGLWVSADGEGRSWRPLTKGLDRPHMYSMAARRIGDRVTLFLGTRPAALYRSDDLGESWQEIKSILEVADTDKWTFPPPPHIAHVKQILFHPEQPETIYVLVEQGAFLKSVDDGKSWTDIVSYSDADDAAYRDVHRLLINPKNPQNFWLCTGVGIYRSDDAGGTWHHLMRRGERMGYPDFVFLDPTQKDVVFMGGSRLNPRNWYQTGVAYSGVMRSADNGANWTEVDKGLPDPIVGAIEAMAQHVWDGGMMLVAGSATGEVYITENGGASWICVADNVAPVSKEDHHLPFIPEERKRQLEIRGMSAQ